MQKAKYSLPIWPYIGAVVCLFVLTLLAPFTWRTVVTSSPATWDARSSRVAVIAPAVPIVARTTSAIAPAAPVITQPILIGPRAAQAEFALPAEADPSVLIAIFPAPRVVTMPAPAVTVTSVPIELSSFEAPRHQAVSAPPVADRVQLSARAPEHATGSAVSASNLVPPAGRLIPVSIEADAPTPPQRAAAIPKSPQSWPHAVSLIEQFRALQPIGETQAWATQAILTLEAIHGLESLGATELAPLLDELGSVARHGIMLAKNASSREMRSRIVRAGYATVRRELLWRQVHQIATSYTPANRSVTNPAASALLAAVGARVSRNANAEAWRKYLRWDEIQDQVREADAETRADLARDVLTRLNSPDLSASQQIVLRQSPFAELERELRRWVVEPIAYPQLLDDIELYELTRSADAAHRIAAVYQVIRWSDDENIAKLGELLNTHYRNANLRLAIRDDLLNRLLPQQDDFEEEVNEEIIGAQVFGNAQASAHLRTVLIPDQHRWRFGLEVEGEVESQTSATRGPATFFNDGYSRYQARKLFQIDRRGVLVSDSEAEANMNSELTGFRTLFDSLPVIGWVARGIARQQHDDQTEMARWVSETRLETKMRERLDREVQAQLEAAQAKVEKKVIAPLQRLELHPDALEMRTTNDRLIARYRLAGENQLGAFTPRPQAPSDSMLSVQVHETMLNNTLEQLGLAGKRTKLRQLYRDLADAFERSDLEVPDEIRENITIQFVDVNPVRVRCEDGKVTLSLQIAELRNRYNKWHDFEVRAEYIPDSTNLHAHLVRDGVVQLIGKQLRLGDQIALRLIFSRALSKNQPFSIINKKLAENPAMADMAVNQFVINDGWIGVALGPHRVAATPPEQPSNTVVR